MSFRRYTLQGGSAILLPLPPSAHRPMKKVVVQSSWVINWWLVAAIGVAVIVALVLFWPFSDDSQQSTTARKTTSPPSAAQTAPSNPCGSPKRVVAPPGQWTRVQGTVGCRWNIQRDPDAGERNYLAVAKVRPNGKIEHEKFIGEIDGRYHTADYPFRVRFYEIMPIGNEPIVFISLGVPENQ